MAEKWMVQMKKADFDEIAEKYGISPILARLIRNRGVVGDDQIDRYLNGTLDDLYDGSLMKDMDQTAALLKEKIEDHAPIRIIGDYDIDGVNATYILQVCLSRLGAVVDTDIPDRVKDGYGLNRQLIDRAIEDGVDTILTCDNGIAAYDEVAYGKKKGLTLLVTDHHEVPYVEEDHEKKYRLPPADTVVDPHRPDCAYPDKELCGAAVAYKLAEVLFRAFGQDPDQLTFLIENVAIATVGDVMNLTGENRILVKEGLKRLSHTQNQGLKALMDVTKVPSDKVTPYHIGYILGPCLNASGRLDTAKRALDLLNAETRREAMIIAEDLKALNDSRKDMTEKGMVESVEQIENSPIKEDKVLVVFLPDCHESIAGIVAGRIRERYGRPAFVLTRSEGGLKGSGRSIDAYNMYEGLSRCQDLLSKFGGHKLAAGLSLPEENLEPFRKRINEGADLTEEDLMEKVTIDMQLPLPYITEELVQEIDLLEPTGKGNPSPLFAEKNLKVIDPRIIGKNRNALKFLVQDDEGNRMEAIYFGQVEECYRVLKAGKRMSFTYYPTINEYQGRRSVQMTVVNYRES